MLCIAVVYKYVKEYFNFETYYFSSSKSQTIQICKVWNENKYLEYSFCYLLSN